MRVDWESRSRGSSNVPLVGAVVLWLACSVASGERSDDSGLGSNVGSGGSASGTSPGNGSGVPVPPAEQETERSYELPVQSGRWVWSANPLSGRVAAIDTRTRSVELARAGNAPTYLAALPAEGSVRSAAIVLNTLSDDASVMRLSDAGISVATVPTHADANAWAVSPSGRFAIAWSDASAATNPDPVESFQDVTVIDTAGDVPVATRLSVGYRPNRIFYAAGEERAFVVSEAGISVIELGDAQPLVSRDVVLARAAGEKPLDVSVVPEGTHALFRVEGSAQVTFVELLSGERVDVTLSGPVTDLDLVADGSSALAVVRARAITPGATDTGGGGEGGLGGAIGAAGEGIGQAGSLGVGGSAGGSVVEALSELPTFAASEVAVLTLSEILEDKTRFEHVMLDDFVGSVAVSDAGHRAVLYTTAVALDRVTVLSTDPSEASYLAARRVRVRAPVDAVFIAPDAAHSVVILKPVPGGSLSGFALLPLLDELPATIKTAEAPITGVAFAPAPTSSAILTAATARTAYVVRLPERQIQAVTLPNLPLAAGIVAEEGLAYVAQKHPEGQLTLVELNTGAQRTLTGFELAGQVIDGN